MIDGAVPRILCEHFEAFRFVEIHITFDDPSLAETVEYEFVVFTLEAALAHLLEVAQGSIYKEKVNILWVVACYMSGHRSAERPTEAADLSFDSKVFDKEFQY